MRRSYREVKLGSIMRRADRFEETDDLKEYQFAGTYSFARGIFAGEKKPGSSFKLPKIQRVHAGDFVYCKIMAWEGAFGIAPTEVDNCVFSAAFVIYEIDRSQVDERYLGYYFKIPDVWKSIGSQSTGTNVRRRSLHPDDFEKTAIKLPPLDEQRRIVARIEQLAAKIEEARGLRRKAEEEANVLLEKAFKKTREEMLESSFPKNKIGNITTVTSGGTPSRTDPNYWHGDIPWIKTGELLDADIYQAEEYISSVGLENSSAKLFPIDTVLVALYGQGQTRGRTGRLMIEAATNQACCAILPQKDVLDARFVQYWIRSLYTQMRENAFGGAQPNWNGQTIKNIEIVLSPLDEQRRIVAHLDALQVRVDTLKRMQAESSAELDALLPSILDKAFRGEL